MSTQPLPYALQFGSVCSGIEAVSLAWEPLGMKAAWFSEIPSRQQSEVGLGNKTPV